MLRTILSALVMGFSVYYFYINKSTKKDESTKRLENVLNGLLSAEKSVVLPTNLSLAVGFGSCLDLIVDAIPLFTKASLQPPTDPKYHPSITNGQELAEMFVFFMKQGAAAERFIPLSLLEELVSAAENIPNVRLVGGGNAPVMSKRFAKDGFTDIVVGAQASNKFKSFFPTSMTFVDDDDDNNDDIHLILEYKVGDRWGSSTATRANRFVVHSDRSNPYLKSLESFHKIIMDVQPRLFIISALQMLDNFPFENSDVRKERMLALQNMLETMPKSTLLHFEMASFGEVAMMKLLLENVLPHVDSLGMNEQELPNLVSMIRYGSVIEVADSNPRTASVLDDMRVLYDHYRKYSKRELTRVHVHTLSFQAILTRKTELWKNSEAGSARASLAAHRHVCAVDKVQIEKARLIMDDSFSVSVKSSKRIYFNEKSPISCWDEEDYNICVAPVLVCTDVKQTIGGGDNITPAGLMPQI